MTQYDVVDLVLYDDDGEEMEAEVRVYYTVQPREPDVGIFNEYAEVSHISMLGLYFGEILFTPTDAQERFINNWLDDGIYQEGG